MSQVLSSYKKWNGCYNSEGGCYTYWIKTHWWKRDKNMGCLEVLWLMPGQNWQKIHHLLSVKEKKLIKSDKLRIFKCQMPLSSFFGSSFFDPWDLRLIHILSYYDVEVEPWGLLSCCMGMSRCCLGMSKSCLGFLSVSKVAWVAWSFVGLLLMLGVASGLIISIFWFWYSTIV